MLLASLLALSRGVIPELEVCVDVSVVKLQVIQDQRLRTVVDKLGALVEESRIVLVGFDDKIFGIAEARGYTEIRRNPTDQESRRMTGILQNPG